MRTLVISLLLLPHLILCAETKHVSKSAKMLDGSTRDVWTMTLSEIRSHYVVATFSLRIPKRLQTKVALQETKVTRLIYVPHELHQEIIALSSSSRHPDVENNHLITGFGQKLAVKSLRSAFRGHNNVLLAPVDKKKEHTTSVLLSFSEHLPEPTDDSKLNTDDEILEIDFELKEITEAEARKLLMEYKMEFPPLVNKAGWTLTLKE